VKVIGGLLSNIIPGVLIPAEVKAEHLSHDPAVFAAYIEDPLVRMQGSMKGIHDMLSKASFSMDLDLIRKESQHRTHRVTGC